MDSAATPEGYVAAVAIEPVTTGPHHHFFGYYDKSPWDASGRHLLAMRIDFLDRMPTPQDELVLGMIDMQRSHAFIELARTSAWCWQQGTMLQWLPGQADRMMVYNQRDGERFIAVRHDVVTGQTRRLPRAIYALDPRGRYALSLNFARLARTRPGYGYEGGHDPTLGRHHGEDDGIYRVDLDSGRATLIFSLDQAVGLNPESCRDRTNWFNHIQVNPDGSRLAFLHRWHPDPANTSARRTRLITLNLDGSEPHLLADEGLFSHYDWFSPTQLIGWSTAHGQRHYHLYRDRSDEVTVVGRGVLNCDGHCSFSPNRRWMLTDTYPDTQQMRTLLLWRWPDGPRIDLGRFFAPPNLRGPLRCDLHPRWSRDGRSICIDSAHTGQRQMYVMDVASLLSRHA